MGGRKGQEKGSDQNESPMRRKRLLLRLCLRENLERVEAMAPIGGGEEETAGLGLSVSLDPLTMIDPDVDALRNPRPDLDGGEGVADDDEDDDEENGDGEDEERVPKDEVGGHDVERCESWEGETCASRRM